MKSHLDRDVGLGVGEQPLFGLIPVVPWDLQEQFSSWQADAPCWLPPQSLQQLHFPVLVASLWQRLLAVVRDPVRRLQGNDEPVLEVLASARIRRHADGMLSASVREADVDGAHLGWVNVPDDSVVLAGMPARFVWLALIRAASAVEIARQARHMGVPCDKEDLAKYTRGLFEHFRHQLVRHADLRAMRRKIADALRLDAEALRLARRRIKLPPAHSAVMIADYNLALAHMGELQALEREVPAVMPLYFELTKRNDFRPLPQPGQSVRAYLAEHDLGAGVWRLICRSDGRLLLGVRDLYQGNAGDAMLDYLRVLARLGFNRRPDVGLMWAMLSRYGHSAARLKSYLGELARVQQAFAHVAKVFTQLPPEQQASDRHELEAMLEWLDLRANRPLDKPQRRAGWPWLVANTQEWRALREAEISACATGWEVPFESMTVGSLELRLIASVADLWTEARTMHHCADTFAKACAGGRTIVASVRDRNTQRRMATARVVRTPTGWRCAQVRGFANRDPHPAVMPGVRALLEKLEDGVGDSASPAPSGTVLGEPAVTERPAAMPRTAHRIGQFEWAWSPMHSCVVRYYVSSNRSRSLWLLWMEVYDDNWGRWEKPSVCAHGPRPRTKAAHAAARLLESHWRQQRADEGSGSERFHMFDGAGLLPDSELDAIGRAVWPDKSPD